MNRFKQFVLVVGVGGVLVGCAQPTAMRHGMVMEQMPMMGGSAATPEMSQMMAACMEHMHPMSSPKAGGQPPAPAR